MAHASDARESTGARNHAIRRAKAAGHSLREIGMAAGLSPQQVSNICNAAT